MTRREVCSREKLVMELYKRRSENSSEEVPRNFHFVPEIRFCKFRGNSQNLPKNTEISKFSAIFKFPVSNYAP